MRYVLSFLFIFILHVSTYAQTLNVSITAPTPRYKIQITDVHDINGTLHVLSEVYKWTDGITIQVVSTISDSISIDSESTDKKIYVVGGFPYFPENKESVTLLDSKDEYYSALISASRIVRKPIDPKNIKGKPHAN